MPMNSDPEFVLNATKVSPVLLLHATSGAVIPVANREVCMPTYLWLRDHPIILSILKVIPTGEGARTAREPGPDGSPGTAPPVGSPCTATDESDVFPTKVVAFTSVSNPLMNSSRALLVCGEG